MHLYKGSYKDSLYLLNWPPCIAIMLNIGVSSYLPRAEASGVLGIVPIGLRDTLYIIRHTSVETSLVLISYHPHPPPSS